MVMFTHTLASLNRSPNNLGCSQNLSALPKEIMTVWVFQSSGSAHITNGLEGVFNYGFHFSLINQFRPLGLFQMEVAEISTPILHSEQSIA